MTVWGQRGGGGGYACVRREGAHARQASRARLSQLSVRNCICAVGGDRAVVYSNGGVLRKGGEKKKKTCRGVPRRTMRL